MVPSSTSLTGRSRTISSRARAASFDRAGPAVELGLPVLDDLVVRVLAKRRVEVRDGLGRLAATQGYLGLEDVDTGRVLPAGADPGDDRRGVVDPVGVELERGELDQRGRAVGPPGDRLEDLAGAVGRLEVVRLDLGAQHGEPGVLGLLAEEPLECGVGVGGLAVLDQQRRLEPGELDAARVGGARLLQQSAGLGPAPHLLEREHGEVLGRRAPLALRPQLREPGEGAVILVELDVDLRQADRDGRRHGLAGGTRLVELDDRPLQVLGASAGLVELALEQVQRGLHVAGKRALLDLAEHRLDDRLGLFGIAGLEDRPGGPELVLRVEHALRLRALEPQGVLEVLAAEVLLLRQHQRDAVLRLGLGDVGQAGGGQLEVIERAVAQLGLDRLRGPCRRRPGLAVRVVARGQVARDPRAVQVDRAGQQVPQGLVSLPRSSPAAP